MPASAPLKARMTGRQTWAVVAALPSAIKEVAASREPEALTRPLASEGNKAALARIATQTVEVVPSGRASCKACVLVETRALWKVIVVVVALHLSSPSSSFLTSYFIFLRIRA